MIKSRRYCLKCRKVTTFKLRKNRKNDLLRHSKCSECKNTRSLSISYAKEEGYIKQGGKQNGK